MQFKQKHNGIEYNVTFFASDKKNLSQVVDQGITFPMRGPPILYLLRFLRSWTLQVLSISIYIYVLFLYQIDHCAISVYPFSL